METLIVFGVIFVVFASAYLLINLRGVIKGEEFRGTCATNNPMLKNTFGDCTVCGKKADEDCKMPDPKSA